MATGFQIAVTKASTIAGIHAIYAWSPQRRTRVGDKCLLRPNGKKLYSERAHKHAPCLLAQSIVDIKVEVADKVRVSDSRGKGLS